MSKKRKKRKRAYKVASKKIKPPALDYPYRRAEVIAGILNKSTATFHRYVKKYDIPKHRRGNGRGFVWFFYDEVRVALEAAGFEDLPQHDLELENNRGDEDEVS